MKSIYKIFPFFFFLMTIISCSHYTDVTPVGNSYLVTLEDYNLLLNPTYGGGVSRHVYDDAEYKLLNDQLAINDLAATTVLTGGAWNLSTINYLFNTNVSRINFLSNSNYNNQYANIANYSIVIDGVASATTGTDAEKKQAIAEARVLRAYCHFVLVNQYAKPYDPLTAATDNGIIIKTHYNIEELLSPSTVEGVYNFIESELKAAIADLSNTPVNAYHPSKACAYGMLAKLYLFKGDIENAKLAAQQSLTLNSYIYDLVQYKQNGGIDPVEVSNPENLYYGMVNASKEQINNTNGYLLTKSFYTSFQAGDVRIDPLLVSTTVLQIPPGSGFAAFTKQAAGATRFCYNAAGLRTTDVYLILAECYARQGDIGDAMNYLNAVRAKRIIPASYTPATASDPITAVKLIIEERKKEFWFGPNRFWDLRRLGREPEYAITVTRRFPLYATGYTQQDYTLQPNSTLFIIPFARTVLAANPNIKENATDAW